MKEIEVVREAEESNYQISRRDLAVTVSLIDDLVGLYQLFSELLSDLKVTAERELEISSLVQFLLACRYQSIVAGLAILRGHTKDSFLFTRRAIEHCAFAARVKRHPHLAEVWLNAGDSQESYSKYRDKFSPGKIFPADHKLLGELYSRYDFCSRFSHPSLYAFADHLHIGQDGSKSEYRFNYFQLIDGKPDEPVRTLLWTVDAHYGILRLFVGLFSDFPGFDRTLINEELLSFENKLNQKKDRWRPVLLE